MITVGHTIGNYLITSKIGEGGMGVVYLAEHPVIGRKVAMKAIHPELSRNQEVVSRFMTEAKAVNQIGNEHIVDIHDFGTTPQGEFYFIMEYLQGEALADRMKRDKVVPAPSALQIAAQVADALAASHSHGIIHRDLKPENIFLIHRGNNPDFVKVLDFGLAKLTQGEEKITHKTRTGSVMGTPYYMSPEQCEGKASIDARSDLYSLGVILFEMLTGRVPFGGDGYGEIIVKHITQAPPVPRSLNPRLSAAHEAVLLRALAKRREDRFRSMQDFRSAMLDPERYLLMAPPLAVTPAPVSMGVADTVAEGSETSGLILFGAAPTEEVTPLHEAQPSTFRPSAVEAIDEDLASPGGSRRGWLVGATLAALVAGGAVAFFVLRPSPEAPPPAPVAAPAAAQVAPPAAAAPKQVAIAFTSDPTGATVTRRDTGANLGVTPFEHAFPAGKNAIEFVFTKSGFDDKAAAQAPDVPGKLAVTLVAAPNPIAEAPAARAPTKQAASRGSQRARPVKGRKPGRPLDEDGVLEPMFR